METATVQIYERCAAEWARRRPLVDADRAEAFAARVAPGALRADLGCGAGRHTALLGEPVVALDAAGAMLVLVPGRAPRALRVQADLEALPFRRRALGGAWASMSYQHLPRARLPLALAELHGTLSPGAPVHLKLDRGGGADGLPGDGADGLPGDDFPGRFFARWRPEPLLDVVAGAGFVVEEAVAADRIEVWARRARSLPDTVAPGMRLLVCGLNPSVYAADAGVGFARPSNRFWPAAVAAGLVTRPRDPVHALLSHGVGMTDLVKRATARSAELAVEEYRAGAARLERLVSWLRPGAVCFVGLEGWRAAVDRRAAPGRQPAGLGGAPAYVMPSTSGLNAHARLPDLVAHLRRAAALADAPSPA